MAKLLPSGARMHRGIGGEPFICSDWTSILSLAVNPAKWSSRRRVASPNEVFDWACVAWTADGQKLVFFPDLGLWTQPLALESTKPCSEVRRSWPSRLAPRSTSSLALPTSPRLAYALRSGGGQSIWRMQIPERHIKGEPPQRMFASTKEEFAQQYSPDGKKVAFESKRGGNLEIWVCDSDGQGCVQLTSMGAPASGVPTWSPDGKEVAFYSNAQGNPQIYVIPSEGGATRRLTSPRRWSHVPPVVARREMDLLLLQGERHRSSLEGAFRRRASCPGNSWRRAGCVRIARWKMALLCWRRRRLQPSEDAGRRR